MLRLFERFREPEKRRIDPIPKAYDIDYLIFQLTDGDITKRDYVLDHFTYADAVRWCLLRRYDAYVQREYMKAD